MHKRKVKFVYLIQGDLTHPMYQIPEGSDFLYLQWQKDFIPLENHIHFPNSSWAEGRNRLYELARDKYDYYVFMDDDLVFCGMNDGIRSLLRAVTKSVKDRCLGKTYWLVKNYCEPWNLTDFENEIRRTGPAVAVPNDFKHRHNFHIGFSKLENTKYFDMNMHAIHQSVIHDLFPYLTRFDKKNWWICGEVLCDIAAKVCRSKVCRVNSLALQNADARNYPRDDGDWEMGVNNDSRYTASSILEGNSE